MDENPLKTKGSDAFMSVRSTTARLSLTTALISVSRSPEPPLPPPLLPTKKSSP